MRVLADATYKLVVEGFPILTIGTTDKSRQFHPFGYAMVYRERQEDFEDFDEMWLHINQI
jgi:hypothetical protein